MFQYSISLLIGNLPDREHEERRVTTESGRRLTESLSAPFMEINVKNEEDVQLAFRTLAEADIEVCVICLHPRNSKCACFTSIQISKEQVLKK